MRSAAVSTAPLPATSLVIALTGAICLYTACTVALTLPSSNSALRSLTLALAALALSFRDCADRYVSSAAHSSRNALRASASPAAIISFTQSAVAIIPIFCFASSDIAGAFGTLSTALCTSSSEAPILTICIKFLRCALLLLSFQSAVVMSFTRVTHFGEVVRTTCMTVPVAAHCIAPCSESNLELRLLSGTAAVSLMPHHSIIRAA